MTTLSAGSRLGPYEILAPLGAGGMGEVYRARDPRLGREVAIKVLPAAFAADPERLVRFEREARSASALSHPNIVAIYDVGSAESVSYIAMELVSGKPLRALLGAALPVRQLLQIAVQVAEGLAKAHGAGIVHRDLKPENVMVTEEGLVKILDFGLAKLSSGGAPSVGTQGLTLPAETEPGIVMGTVGYMSPEQALGKTVDHRSDQFSLGAILYEMATGRRAFNRASAPETLTAVIRDEPERIVELNPNLPAPLRWTIERCLGKEPRSRYASTEDLALELATVRDHLSEATSAVSRAPELPARLRRRRWLIALSIAAAGLIVLGVMLWRLRVAASVWRDPLAGARYTRVTDWEGTELGAAVSADGKFVAFVSDRDGPYDVWVSQLGGGEFLNLTKGQVGGLGYRTIRNAGFSDDAAFVWWPDAPTVGKAVLWRVPTMGGVPRPFLSNGPMDAQWSPDGTRLLFFKNTPGDPIFVGDRQGGNALQIATEPTGKHQHFPTWSTDGRFVYFARGASPTEMDVWRVASDGGEAERLTHHNSDVSYLTSLDRETLLYSAQRPDGLGSGLWALDLERRATHAVTSGIEEYISVSASADGGRLVAAVASPSRNLWTVPITDHVVDESGVKRFEVPSVRAGGPRFGPSYVVYLSSRGGANGLRKFENGSDVELWSGSNGAVEAAAAISPDGARICFAVRRGERWQLQLVAKDGTDARPLAESLDVRGGPSWSPDGKWIAVVVSESGTTSLYKVPVDGDAPVRVLEGSAAAGVVSRPLWSPDDRVIIYTMGTGSSETFLRGVTPDGHPFPVPQLAMPYVTASYRFLPDGSALVVMNAIGPINDWIRHMDFWLLDLATGSQRQLTDLKPGFDINSFDVSPDGKQILFERYRENSDIVLIDLQPRS